MQSTYSTTLTNSPESFSVGVLPVVSTPQWGKYKIFFDPIIGEPTATNRPDIVLAWHQDVSGGRISHIIGFHGHGLNQGFATMESIEQRVHCYNLLSYVPNDALLELRNFMIGLIEYYSYIPTPVAEKPPAKRFKSRIRRVSESQNFTFEED